MAANRATASSFVGSCSVAIVRGEFGGDGKKVPVVFCKMQSGGREGWGCAESKRAG